MANMSVSPYLSRRLCCFVYPWFVLHNFARLSHFNFSQFFSLQIVTNITFILGPVGQYHQNSKYYSAIPPTKPVNEKLPHITIQMPVYKESLRETMCASPLFTLYWASNFLERTIVYYFLLRFRSITNICI